MVDSFVYKISPTKGRGQGLLKQVYIYVYVLCACDQFGFNQSRLFAEKTRMRLQYDEARRKLSSLKVRLANIEDQMIPGQSQCDKDRYAPCR